MFTFPGGLFATDTILGVGGNNYPNNTILLMHMDGEEGSSNFIDEKGHTITRNGTPTISRQQSKFGGSSLYLNGSANNQQYLTVSSPTDFDFGIQDFTMECWFYKTNNNSNTTCLFSRYFQGGDERYGLIIENNKLTFSRQDGGGNVRFKLTGVSSINANTWYHAALSRRSNSIYLFLNGQMEASIITAGTVSGNGLFRIGVFDTTFDPSQFGWFWQGYIDEMRFLKGIGAYAEPFTPSTQPFSIN